MALCNRNRCMGKEGSIPMPSIIKWSWKPELETRTVEVAVVVIRKGRRSGREEHKNREYLDLLAMERELEKKVRKAKEKLRSELLRYEIVMGWPHSAKPQDEELTLG